MCSPSRALHFPCAQTATHVSVQLWSTRSAASYDTITFFSRPAWMSEDGVSTVLTTTEQYPGNKRNHQPNRFWSYPVKSAVILLMMLSFCVRWITRRRTLRLVGQIGEVGRGDSWEAVGAPPQGTSMWLTCSPRTQRMHRRFGAALMAQPQRTRPAARSALHTFWAQSMFLPYILVMWLWCVFPHTCTCLCVGRYIDL